MPKPVSEYVPRSLADGLLSSSKSVVVLEGARAVGKTRLVRTEVERRGFSYVTLADEGTYRYAKSNLTEWVKSLPLPVIIDEAQRIKELPLAVKEIVDSDSGKGVRFLLTGSASIGRDGLGGQDPLTRRATRSTLYPMTQRELRRRTGSALDLMWGSFPNEDYRGAVAREELCAMMAVGGFPSYALDGRFRTEDEMLHDIGVDIDGVLGDTVLPDERLDRTRARAVLDGLLTVPGGILNVNRLSNELGVHAETVRRYLGIFMRRFLVQCLPNLKNPPQKQSYARSKVHPVDTSFCVEALRRKGQSIVDTPTLFGALFESFVVAQLVPEAQWSKRRSSCFYWRESGRDPKEVDLVFENGAELLGVEVKAAQSVDEKDFRGLWALARDSRFARGYVVYAGDRVKKFSDTMWAIPVSALWDDGGFIERTGEKKLGSTVFSGVTLEESIAESVSAEVDAQVFLSYCHKDNDHLNGAITDFMQEVLREYEYQYGNSLNLFVDTEGINWGADWRAALDRGIDAANLVVPAVTPSYILSSACRKEFTAFADRLAAAKHSVILPLIWQDVRAMRGAEKDSIWQKIESLQQIRVDGLRDVTPDMPQYKACVREVVAKLRAVIDELQDDVSEGNHQDDPRAKGSVASDEKDLLSDMESLNDELEVLKRESEGATAALQRVFVTMNDLPVPSSGVSATKAWSMRLAERTKDDISDMEEHLVSMETSWSRIMAVVNDYFEAISLLPEEMDRVNYLFALESSLYEMKRGVAMPDELRSGWTMLQTLQLLTPRLKPLSQGFRSFADVFDRLAASVDDLLDRVKEVK